jgi:membrane protease YdiL (CAAX protease family)
MKTAAADGGSPGARSGRVWKPALGLLVALSLPFLPIGHWLAPGEDIASRLVHEAVWWAYAAMVLVWLTRIEGRSLASIGFRTPTWRTLVFAVLAGLVLTAIMFLHFAVLGPLLHLDTAAAGAVRAKIMQTPYWYRMLLVLRAAVVEEILFRAYLMEKVRQLSGSWLVAGVVSVVAFTLAHLSGWGLVHLIPVFGAAIVFAALYRWRRDTPCNIIAHFLTDGAGFLTS